MENISFIHCGDIHLDARFTSTGLTDIKARQRRQEIRDTFSVIIDKVIVLKVPLLLIAGDFFEQEYISRSTAEFILAQLKRIPNVEVFISPGNHDPYIVNSYYSIWDWPVNVHIFTGDMGRVELPEYNTVIYGIGFCNKCQYESMLDEISELDQSKTNILLVHGTLDVGVSECQYHPISSRHIHLLGFNYAALGHIHKISNKDSISKSIIQYCGSPEPLGFDEPGRHGIIHGKISEDRLILEHIKLNQRDCVTQVFDITGIVDVDTIETRLKEQLKSLEKDLVKVAFVGKKDRNLGLDMELITSRLSDLCFYLKIADETQPDYPLEELMKQNNLTGIFVRKLLSEIESEQDEQRKGILYQALYLGLDALGS
ncbi:MAG: metallophosphoesterase [Clostridia bacterium]